LPFCTKCGAKHPSDVNFCPQCGAAVHLKAEVHPTPEPARTGFEIIGSDRKLQDHWVRRVIAIVIDSIIVAIAGAVLITLIILPVMIGAIAAGNFLHPTFSWYYGWLQFPLVMGILYILYFTFAETSYGWTIGKKAMGLKVTLVNGQKLSVEKSFIRNVSKIYWVILLLDVVVGLATQGDPHQKYSDRIAGTNVIEFTSGTPVSSPKLKTVSPPVAPAPSPPPPHRPTIEDPLGLVSLGVFFMIIAATWSYYPTLPSEILAYFKSFGVYGHPVMPPLQLYRPITFFASIFGVWLFILAGLRLLFRQRQKKALGDASGGVFFIFLSYILIGYSQGTVAGNMVLPLIIVLVGIIIVVNGVGQALLYLKH